MKKIVLSILGIFVLAACSEDVYHDIDKQNNGWEAGNPASDGSGGNAPFTHVPGSPPYDSPWDISGNTDWGFPMKIPYRFENQTGDWGSPYLITLRVTPYVGLAYYDPRPGPDYYETALDPIDYPNLYPIPGGNKIGHFIPAFPITLDGSGLSPGSIVREIESSMDHCPVLNAMTNPLNPLPTIHFDLPPGGAPAPVTWQEEELLSQYGKVFFYFCEAIDPVTNMVVWSKYMMPDSSYPTAPPGHWTGAGVSVNIPSVGIVPLVYSGLPLSTASQELILNIGSVFPPPPPPPLPSFPQYASYYEFPYKGVTIFV